MTTSTTKKAITPKKPAEQFDLTTLIERLGGQKIAVMPAEKMTKSPATAMMTGLDRQIYLVEKDIAQAKRDQPDKKPEEYEAIEDPILPRSLKKVPQNRSKWYKRVGGEYYTDVRFGRKGITEFGYVKMPSIDALLLFYKELLALVKHGDYDALLKKYSDQHRESLKRKA